MRVTYITLPVTLRPCPPHNVALRYAERCGAGSGYGRVDVPIPGLTGMIGLDVMAVRFPDEQFTCEVIDNLAEIDLAAIDLLPIVFSVQEKYPSAQLEHPMSAVGVGIEADGNLHCPCLAGFDTPRFFLARYEGFEWRSIWHFLALPREQAARLHALLC